jgi:thiol-disulfide isomerase/thioredoxin
MTPAADRFLNTASVGASLVLAATLAITLAFVSWPRVASALGLEPAGPAAAYAPGATIDTPAAWHGRTAVTLVVFARAGCGACQKAEPYFTQLFAELNGRADVVVVGGRETADEDAAFARALGLGEAAFHVAPDGLRVRVTPTLVLVDRAGRVLDAWEGIGPVEKQTSITSAVRAALR